MNQRVKAGIRTGARTAHMTEEEFIESIFRYQKREYDLEDIEAWMQDNNVPSSDIRPEEILVELYHHGDSNLDLWSNIRDSYKRVCRDCV